MHVPQSGPTDATEKAQSKPVALFVSDVHLQESMPRTTQAFLDFLHNYAVKADQLYLLGDLFEYWAGDDDLDASYIRRIVDALRAVNDSGAHVFWIAGNRDFLVGERFAKAAGLTILPDPSVVTIGGQRIVLAHGDAQCTDDHDYMAFRAQVRQQEWQRQFLAMPLAQRKAVIEGLRNGSRAAQRAKSYEIMDVNPTAIAGLFETSGASLMVHGHTHRPARHEHLAGDNKCVRYVLPDWDYDTGQPRGGWLALHADGSIARVELDGSTRTVA